MSVSYTHLDVYKRQEDGNCMFLDDGDTCACPQTVSFSVCCKWFRWAVLPLDGTPVSYTHLDVYKRQIEDNAKLTEKHLQIIKQQTADTEELITE